MRYYLDTSAAMKALVAERESVPLGAMVDSVLAHGDELCSSWLLHTELHCAATRRAGLPSEETTALLGSIELFDISREHLMTAATSRWGLRAADAIHVATALAVECDAVITYDREILALLASIGVRTLSPGR